MLMIPDRDVPPPKRPMISENLRRLKKGESLFFAGGSPSSVQSLITRLKKNYDGARDYTTEWQGNGVRVWRVK